MSATLSRKSEARIAAARIQSGKFPKLTLPFKLPYPPMEARRSTELPTGAGWQYEPKWDGFRALVFRDGDAVVLQSKAGQPLARYFPELVDAFRGLRPKPFVLDGEIIVAVDGQLSFDDLLLRIHPSQSRIERLAAETPATYNAFDLLYRPSGSPRRLTDLPLRERRRHLEDFFARLGKQRRIRLTPMTLNPAVAQRWFADLAAMGLDGVIAKKTNEYYRSGDRLGMVKVKRLKTADCVVGGFRYATGSRAIGSLLLGLYDRDGLLHHVGFTSGFNAAERRQLKKVLEPYRDGSGFSGRAPGGPSRWSTERSAQWEPLEPKLVCEIRYDYFTQGRFRHGVAFLRWRPEKKPRTCTLDQVTAKRR